MNYNYIMTQYCIVLDCLVLSCRSYFIVNPLGDELFFYKKKCNFILKMHINSSSVVKKNNGTFSKYGGANWVKGHDPS